MKVRQAALEALKEMATRELSPFGASMPRGPVRRSRGESWTSMADETKSPGPTPGRTPANPRSGGCRTACAAAGAQPRGGSAAAGGRHGRGAAAAPRPSRRAAAKPAAPRPPVVPPPDFAGKTTSAASAGGAAARAAAPAGAEPATAAATARDADDTSPLLTRRAWMGLAWGAFSAASAAALAATGRFMFPNVLNEPPQQFKAGFPNEYGAGRRRALEREVRRLARADRRRHRRSRQRLLRAARDLHAPRLHAELPVGRKQVQVPVPRQRLPHHRHQLRGAGAAAARARAHRARRRRPDPGRQVAQVSVRARTVDRSRSVSEGVARALRLQDPGDSVLRHQMEDGRE